MNRRGHAQPPDTGEAGRLPGVLPTSQPVCPAHPSLLLSQSTHVPSPSAVTSVLHIRLSSKQVCSLTLHVCISGLLESRFLKLHPHVLDPRLGAEYWLSSWKILCEVFDLGID